MYADDLIIYCKANEAEAREVVACLQLYCEWIGQQINWKKSVAHFTKNTPDTPETVFAPFWICMNATILAMILVTFL